MNKHLLLGILFLVFLIPYSVHAEKIAMIVKDASNLSIYHETSLKDILENMGHDITLVDNSTSITYSDYDLIVVAGRPKQETALDSFVKDIPVNDHPTVAIDYYYPDDWGWSTHMRGIDANSVSISNTSHPIVSGYTGTKTVYDPYFSNGKLIFTQSYETNLDQVAYYGTVYSSVISVAETNTTLSNGNVTNSRIVLFGVSFPKYWNSVAEDLFKNSVDWVLAGESLNSKELDVDDDGVDEQATNSDSNIINGYENYTDSNNNTAVTSLDADDDGKTDYLIDINNTEGYDKYWDPDDEFLSNVTKSGEYYLIDIDDTDGGMPDKVYYNETLSILQTLEYDVNSDAVNETILDVNSNNETDSIDMIWDDSDNLVYGLPDLTVTDITFSNDNPTSGDSVTITALLENDGYDEGEFLIEFLVDGSVKESRTFNITDAQFSWSAVAGTHEIKISLDSDEKIFESDEANNERAESLSVNSPDPSPSPGGDGGTIVYEKKIQITAPDSIDIEKDEEYSFKVYVKNTGNVNLKSVMLKILGIPSSWTKMPAETDIPIGQEKSFSVTLKPRAAGSYNFSLKAYSQNSLLKEKTILLDVNEPEVKEPNITITDFALPNMSAGESSVVSLQLKNTGNDIGAVTVFLVVPEDWTVSPEEVMISLNPEEERTVDFNLALPGNASDSSIEAHAVYYDNSGMQTAVQTAELALEERSPLTGMATFVGNYIIFIAAFVIIITAITVFYSFGRESKPPWSSSIKTKQISSNPKQKKIKTNKLKFRVVS